MKIFSIYTAIVCCTLFAIPVSAQQKETIKIWGNCGMCKKTIEKAAKDGGATTADWDTETKLLKVIYAANKTSNLQIQQAIAKSGYDTQDVTANDSAYSQLHGCCQYERKSATAINTTDEKCCDNTACGKEAGACKEMAACKEKSCCKM